MNGLFGELLAILEKETRVYEDLFRISKQKTQVIVENKVSELESITRIEQTLVVQIGRIESERENVVSLLAQAIGKNPSDITLSELVKMAKGQEVEQMRKAQLKLTATLEGLKQANAANSKLIANSLEYIDFSMNLMTNTQASDNRYGRSGNPYESGKRSMFDLKL